MASPNINLRDPVLYRIRHAAHQGEIGYWMRPDRRREGLTTEAVAGLLSSALAPASHGGWGLRRVEIYCGSRNAGSRRVPEKLGLRLESHRRADRWVDGIGWEDKLGWAVRADDWDVEGRRLRHAPA